ncbi:MAG: beta-ketoacyl synthase chain length factor [Bacteroidetes bacterium]|nr:beta-ketoacyl synthase chain length factor [Bacteroidota bacterium]
MKPMFIISSTCISPQNTFEGLEGLKAVNYPKEPVYYCQEPDFSKYINPVQIRRMSRALKMGYTAAIDALNKSGFTQLDAIIIGTGKGCMSDTEIFLHSIVEYQETALNATHFIHSTYNQLNGLIALNKKISCYNITYVHRGFSLEHALLDAALYFAEHPQSQILVGSFDEMTPDHFKVKKQWGYWKEEPLHGQSLLYSKTPGTLAGEGSAFFVLSSEKPKEPAVKICDIQTLYSPESDEVVSCLNNLLERNQLQKEEIDLLMLGENGDVNHAQNYPMIAGQFPEAEKIYFKHLCGEYDTAINFGLWTGYEILLKQMIPESMQLEVRSEKKTYRHLLIYNNYFGKNQGFMLLKLEN